MARLIPFVPGKVTSPYNGFEIPDFSEIPVPFIHSFPRPVREITFGLLMNSYIACFTRSLQRARGFQAGEWKKPLCGLPVSKS